MSISRVPSSGRCKADDDSADCLGVPSVRNGDASLVRKDLRGWESGLSASMLDSDFRFGIVDEAKLWHVDADQNRYTVPYCIVCHSVSHCVLLTVALLIMHMASETDP